MRPHGLSFVLSFSLALSATTPEVAAQVRDAEGCCKIASGCTVLRWSRCVGVAQGEFFASAECDRRGECVTYHTVRARADFDLSLSCAADPPLDGHVALLGEAEIARVETGAGGGSIPTEIVELQLHSAPPVSLFGPLELHYEEVSPPTWTADLDSGEVTGRLLSHELVLLTRSPPCPPAARTDAALPLSGSGIFSFPPLDATLASPAASVAQLVADSTTVGEIGGLSLHLLDTEAADCPDGPVPAATLLFPYFEVDLQDPAGLTTLFAVVNRSAGFVLARVTLWTDLGVPTLAFWVYLSPSDVQTLNVRDLLQGKLPDTSAVLSDPERPVLDFDPCRPEDLAGTKLPGVPGLAGDHTGAPDPVTALCSAIDRGDGVARGYVTVDTVRRCAFAPTVAAYQVADELFDPAELTQENVLWGDFAYVDPSNNFAQGQAAVHLPARPLDRQTGDSTFYGRYNGFTATDARQPLAGHYQVRYVQGGAFDGGTRLIVWRDNLSADVAPHACGAQPSWQPLGEAGVVAWDEEENSVAATALASICPGAAGVSFACDLAGLPFPFGMLDLDLAHGDGTAAQAVVVAVLSAEGRYSVGSEAVAVDNPCEARKTLYLQPSTVSASPTCEYRVAGRVGSCPFAIDDTLYVDCPVPGTRCPLRHGEAIWLCPGDECRVGVGATGSTCSRRPGVQHWKVVPKCSPALN